MSHIQFIDELTREYLLFRGFTSTLKAFDNELKADKDKGFRVDKIVEQFVTYITSYDLSSLLELWNHLDQRIFSRLEHNFTPAIRKIETSLLKVYIVNTISNNKPDKTSEFFNKMAPELQGQTEWKDWFALPYIKNPEENPAFAMYFTRHWQDTLFASLHNFLAIIFQSMPMPTLASFEEEASKIKRFTEENDLLRSKLAACGITETDSKRQIEPSGSELMDDFFIIAQETPSSESQSNPIKNLIKTIGGGIPTSPIMGRKQTPSVVQPMRKINSVEEKRSSSKTRVTTQWSVGAENVPTTKLVESNTKDEATTSANKIKEESTDTNPFLLLSQETYNEHKAAISQCKFNSSGSLVASADADGVVKLWSTTPSQKTNATFTCRSSVVALDWLSKPDRYFVIGTRSGSIHLCDSKDNKVIWEISNQNPPLKDNRIINLCCNPVEAQFVCSVAAKTQTRGTETISQGKLLLFDIKTKKLERSILLSDVNASSSVIVTCCTFNHNGQLLVTGASDGVVRIFDLRRAECIDSWLAHLGSVYSIQLSVDFTSCYSLGQDGKFCQKSFEQSGNRTWETTLAEPLISGVHGQLFTFDQSGKFVLMCNRSGESLYKVTANGLSQLLQLSATQTSLSHATAVDWYSANDCSTCLAGFSDGRLKISTLLQQ